MIKIETTTTGFKVRHTETLKSGKTKTRLIGRASTMDEVDSIITEFEDARA